MKPGGIGDDRLLEADLGAIGERSDHRGVLAPPLRPALLRRRIAIGILQPFHVADDARDETEALHPAKQIHLHARLVTIARRQNHAVLARVHLQNRADGRIDLGVHQHDGLAVPERLEDDMSAELD